MRISRILAIAGAQIRRVFRDPAVVAMFVAVPLVGALVFGLADQRANDSLIIGVVRNTHDPLAGDLVAQFKRESELRVNTYGDVAALKRAVRRGDVQAGVLLPESYDKSIGAQQQVHLSLLGDASQSTFVGVRAATLLILDRESLVVAQARRTAQARGESVVDALPAARALATTPVTTQQLTAHGLTKVSGLGRSVAGMLVFFVFAVAMSYAVTLAQDRQNGIVARVATTHASDTEIIAGEIGGRVVMSAMQGFAIIIFSVALLHVRWGNLIAVALVVLLFSIVAASLGVIIGCHLNGSTEQSVFATDGLMALLGVVGGCFFALALLPDWAREAGHLTPHAWAVDAFDRLRATNGGIAAVGAALLALGSFAAISFLAAVHGLRRSLGA